MYCNVLCVWTSPRGNANFQVKDRLKMHKDREEERLSGAANKLSAEDEYESRVRESEVRGFCP